MQLPEGKYQEKSHPGEVAKTYSKLPLFSDMSHWTGFPPAGPPDFLQLFLSSDTKNWTDFTPLAAFADREKQRGIAVLS